MRDHDKIEIDRGTLKRWLRGVAYHRVAPDIIVDGSLADELDALLKAPRCEGRVRSMEGADEGRCILGRGHHRFMGTHPQCCDEASHHPIHKGDHHRLDPAYWTLDSPELVTRIEQYRKGVA